MCLLYHRADVKRFIPLFCLLVVVLAACAAPAPVAQPAAQATSGPATAKGQGELAVPNDLATALPTLAVRASAIETALKANPPVLKLSDDGLDAQQKQAQDIALANANFLQYVRNPQTGDALRNEIMGVTAARESDITQATEACRTSKCYRVELYNYAYNLTTIGTVDLTAKVVLAVSQLPDQQPEIPQGLKDLATKIAVNSPEVQQALGAKPSEADALMASTKTSLNGTRCERSRHLCVAPTFVQSERALWAIVDLTENKLVGVRWTSVTGRGPRITEQNLADEVISEKYCLQNTPVQRGGWGFEFILTSSDGLRISSVTFEGKPVLNSAKVVDWHVSYSQREGFGYSDAIGCPTFSSAAVIPYAEPRFDDIQTAGSPVGFALTQEFRSLGWPLPCNYSYRQRYEFYADGRFRMVVASIGSGCGDDGTYRPVLRMELAGDDWTTAAWDGSAWKAWDKEQWTQQKPDTAYTKEGYELRLARANGTGFFVEPGRGQFGDGGRGDFAFSYVTRRDPAKDEGESDLITIGPCCNTDYKQGPEKFIEPTPESITNAPIVFWYVAQLKNDDTPGREYCWARNALAKGMYEPQAFPCFAGPMLVPVKKK